MADLTKRENAILAAFRRVFGDELADKAKARITGAQSSAFGTVEAERKERERQEAAAAAKQRQAREDDQERWWDK